MDSCLENVCPSLEKMVRSFIVMDQTGCDQLVDILLMGWWCAKCESASSTFRSNQSEVDALVGCIPSLTTDFSLLRGFSICKRAQSCRGVHPSVGNQDLAPRLHCHFS